MTKRRLLFAFSAVALMAVVDVNAASGTAIPPTESDVPTNAPLPQLEPQPTSWRDLSRWSFQGGVGLITGSSVDDILMGQSRLADGDAKGEIYLLQVSYKLREVNASFWGMPAHFDLELPVVLGLVNERGSSVFPQYSAAFAIRWKNFPWNRWVYTNIEMGVGLTYSAQVLATERFRHPDRERSHLEFYWPIQLMLAHPRYQQHQLVLFNHHHSGGAIFHTGGANTLGFGYRYLMGQ